MKTEPTPPLAAVDQPRLVVRLREACNGHPHAKIPWPHRLLHDAADEIEILRTALADAIRRPMGVIPASAEGHISDEEIRRAEEHRMKFKPDGERVYSSHNTFSPDTRSHNSQP